MPSLTAFFASRWGPILTGAVIGVLAAFLVQQGNPGNMGVCVACFTRDTAGALGLHRASTVQYIRPELIGLVLGALAAALLFREFQPRTGAAPLVRFLLGAFAVIGALVFLGCPWRAFLRLAGGDGNAIAGLLGLTAGIALGVVFLTRGYSLGRHRTTHWGLGWLMPLLMLGLLALLLVAPQFGRAKDAAAAEIAAPPIFFSMPGTPGGQHPSWWLSLAAGLLIGFLAQRARFCTVGGIRDLILLRDPHLFNGAVALVAAALVTNLALGQFRAGFAEQPLAHQNQVWNFLGMALAGLAFTLAHGCPGRQFILAGEGDGDAAVCVLGMFAGAACAHNFMLASTPKDTGPYGPIAVIVGLAVCVLAGLLLREPKLRTGGPT